jgi:4'-phosphopantetheinyl transferase
VEVGLNPLKLDNVAGEWQLLTAVIGDNYRATVVIEGSDRVIKTFGLSDCMINWGVNCLEKFR